MFQICNVRMCKTSLQNLQKPPVDRSLQLLCWSAAAAPSFVVTLSRPAARASPPTPPPPPSGRRQRVLRPTLKRSTLSLFFPHSPLNTLHSSSRMIVSYPCVCVVYHLFSSSCLTRLSHYFWQLLSERIGFHQLFSQNLSQLRN